MEAMFDADHLRRETGFRPPEKHVLGFLPPRRAASAQPLFADSNVLGPVTDAGVASLRRVFREP
jgi:hypothetical protein